MARDLDDSGEQSGLDPAGVIAAYGLPGAPCLGLRRPPDDDEWSQIVRVVENERLAGLLPGAIEDGILPATEAQHAEALELKTWAMRLCVSVERRTLEVLELLDSRGIEYRCLKGPAVAHLDYEDPGLRCFRDIDLLVRPADFGRALEALGEAGWTRQWPEPRPGFDARFGKGTSLRAQGGQELDLHVRFATGPFAQFFDVTRAFADPEPFRLGGREVLALSAEQRFVHACFHALLGDAPPHRLWSLRDVAQMLLAGRLEPSHALRLAAGAERPVIARAVAAAWDRLGLGASHPVATWAAGYRPTWREQYRLLPYRRGSDYAGQALVAVGSVPGLRARAAYVRALAWPDPGYLAGRDSTRSRRWLRAARVMAGLRRNPASPR